MVEKAFYYGFSRKIAHFIFAIVLFLSSFVITLNFNSSVEAHGIRNVTCFRCNPNTCNDSRILLETYHSTGRNTINNYITNRFIQYREWLLETFWRDNLLNAMMRMTEQLSAVGMHQMFAVGTMVDAKVQLEAQRDIQHLQWQAVKDYQPSENFCWFGTNVRSISASEHAGMERTMTLNAVGMTRQLATANSGGVVSVDQDKEERWNSFVANNCMVFNNNWNVDNPTISGLEPLCGTSANSERANRDIHYGRFIDNVRTIDDIDFLTGNVNDIESDLISMSRYLYGHQPPKRGVGSLLKDTSQTKYFDLRSIIAKRNVAQNSFNTIVGLKSPGTATVAGVGTGSNTITMEFMASLIRDLGVNDFADIEDLIGEDPSYYAQLELLSKRIYQDQSFYANLYDKPENVNRTLAAMRAIEMMVDREIYESQLRREMIISVLLSAKLQDNYEEIQANLQALVGAE